MENERIVNTAYGPLTIRDADPLWRGKFDQLRYVAIAALTMKDEHDRMFYRPFVGAG